MIKEFELEPVYDSEKYDIVTDLINPLLEKTKIYYRGVGYFSSGWLKVASKGLLTLAESGGKAYIIASPVLSEKDFKAISDGFKAKKDEILKFVLSKQVEDLENSLEKDTLNALAWLIADDILEFKIAIPRDKSSLGLYHDKVGLFIDEKNDYVVVHGSLNDSIQGTENGEAYSVFKSWEIAHKEFATNHKDRLLRLWNGENKQFYSFNIPKAIKDKLISFRENERPYRNKLNSSFSKRITAPFDLHNYQETAISKWEENTYCGLFEMATGTGKTFTAINCALRLYEKNGRILTIVSVPYVHLMEQWASNISEFNFKVLKIDTSKSDWNLRLKMSIQDFSVEAIDNLFVVAVHDTCSGEKFQNAIKSINPNRTLFIADEVHGLGSKEYRKALNPGFKYRLGLSATPRRWYDDEGTEFILNYFKNIVFNYSLEDAIKSNFLTKYEYKPILIELSETEQEEYNNLSLNILSLKTRLKNNRDKIQEIHSLLKTIEHLYRERVAIISNASGKTASLISIIKDLLDKFGKDKVRHILVYCPPGGHKNVLQKLSQLGLRCHEFVHTVSPKDRQSVLKQFESGAIQVLVAVKCLDEGVDVPATETAFITASSSNPKEFIQRRGRVLRKSEGKDISYIYDFIVVPNSSLGNDKDTSCRSIIQREFPRFAEFAALAENKYHARKIVWPILEKYEMLDYIDKLPWEIYHEINGKEGSSNG